MAQDEQLVYGLHAVLEALEAGKDLEKVLLRRGGNSELQRKLKSALAGRNIPVQLVPVERLNRITRKNHQGVVAWISAISYSPLESILPAIFERGEDPLLLLLDGVSDVRNFGAIARSAECAGVHALVIPQSGAAAIGADAIKTSAGALHRIPVCRSRNLEEAVKFMKNSGLKAIAATEKAKESLYDTDLRGPSVLLMGSEERGISPVLLKEADHWVSIPMKGSISSLNVSVAAGVMLFEINRQRG
ncbi:MAG: 23S rRNA (guanosine(2251)-2'-O)-methyltransferase RlmB [Bacteroidales bacterium]